MKLVLVSDFNLQNFAGYLANADRNAPIDVALAAYGQVEPVILSPDPVLWHPKPAGCVIWTRPECVLPTFQALLDGAPTDTSALAHEVDNFVQLLRRATSMTPLVFVPTWVLPPYHSGHGLADLATPMGPLRALMAANLRLLEAVEKIPGVYPLAAARWTEMAGIQAHNARLWYGAKVPFGNDVFKQAARDVVSALRGIRGQARKLILVDLDDTLWGGTVGETGWEGLQLGGHDPEGEALVDFQKELKALSRRGIALGILSKNEEAVALDAIRRPPEMILRLDDFAGWRINWMDKAANLAELVRELNLGLESVVFLDDNPAERTRIRESFPAVLVPDLPDDKRLFRQALVELDCFNKPTVTEEDRERVRMYTEERKRAEIRSTVLSLDDWLAGLRIVVTTAPLTSANLARVTQLLNKTNQMNLSTRRLAENELAAWAATPGCAVWGLRVADRFGDSGLTGVMGIATEGNSAVVTDFVLSCRVMGRRVEETMLHIAVAWARQAGLKTVRATHLPTSKNRPCVDFFRRSLFRESAPGTFVWDTATAYPRPNSIEIRVDGEGQIFEPAGAKTSGANDR